MPGSAAALDARLRHWLRKSPDLMRPSAHWAVSGDHTVAAVRPLLDKECPAS